MHATKLVQFITIQNPDHAKDRSVRRLARSHAVARGIEKKRKLEQKSGHNFRIVSIPDDADRPSKKIEQEKVLGWIPSSLLTPQASPFQTLTAESPKLQTLLSNRKSQKSTEPVFSVSDELVLQSLGSTLRKGLDDDALLNAVMLTFAFAVSSGSIDKECLDYQSDALSSIRQSMSSPERATSESTLGAILLLAGIDARLGMPRQVQLHMGAIRQLLDRRHQTCHILVSSMQIFFIVHSHTTLFRQDLNSSVMTGSKRVVDHTTFSELHWARDPFTPNFYILPPGFQALSHMFEKEFIEILKDVHGLKCIRDNSRIGRGDVVGMARIDNHQASIQSRLAGIQTHSPISECCRLAAYLCSTSLRCKIWPASTIPSHLSSQLLYKLQEVIDDPVWDDCPDFLAWLLHIGGAFALPGAIRSSYLVLLRSENNTRLRGLYKSWPELLQIVNQFIWSEIAFALPVKKFWEDSSS
ncbi:uncharacterized protein NECHADRAFT_97992 [Fusarium vanettenii 77-13-4]|uniref:Transcription factor domain-containing protein n=1 Tax=Fusarium vanettenii (strain ATCC MYA-4622 / CBS 123669 / FGSC 9596 / NRRL 45880 / 77-13-4) TaxID=660122 RepID=C7ZDE7_FUSV7|nr:uncharacterized protein NECHADRAFT_97992 [Fusarium vanettenii 77-13-4]EEU37888.1 hypothetical protein NECHADRAFT_97992 [Fusarium vanettenii 77-13-4]